jgi:hypothetical protein
MFLNDWKKWLEKSRTLGRSPYRKTRSIPRLSRRLFIEELEARTVPSLSLKILGTDGLAHTTSGTEQNFGSFVQGTSQDESITLRGAGINQGASIDWTLSYVPGYGNDSTLAPATDIFPSSGTLTANKQRDSVVLTFTTSSLALGTYHGELIAAGGSGVTSGLYFFTFVVQSSGMTSPTVIPPPNQTALEGAPTSFNLGSFIDPDGGPWTVDVNWNDGTPDTVFSVSTAGSLGSQTHTYADEGTYAPAIKVTDSTGLSNVKAFSVSVSDRVLTATGGFSVRATEGNDSGSQQVASFTDANPTAPLGDFTATINWGDNTTPTTGTITQPGGVGTAFLVFGSHTYAEESAPGTPYTITVSITDVGGSTASATSSATVADAKLTGTGGFTVTATEGIDSGRQQVASFTDANPTASLGDFTATIDWGGNTPPTTGTITQPGGVGTVFLVFGSHTYAEESAPGTPYKITVSITDLGGSKASVTSSATVADANLTGIGGFTVTAPEGSDSRSQQVAAFTDANPTAPLSDFTTTIDWGDNTTPTTGTFAQPGGPGTAFLIFGSHTYAEESTPGTPYTITVSIADVGGSKASVTSSATVADAKLTVIGGFTVTATEGTDSGSQQVAAFTDANPAAPLGDFTATINWGDNTTPATGTISQPGGVGTAFLVFGSHTYAEDSTPGTPYTITVSITDVGGSTASVTSSATVADARLTGNGGFTVTATEVTDSGSQQVATFTDANPTAPLGDFKATINWGDGSPTSTGTITQPGGVGTSFLVFGSQTYAEEIAPGTSYTITVSITDVGGSTAWVTSSATVADANLTGIGGFTVTATEGIGSGSQQVATFTDANPKATLSDFTATIDWGDNTTPTTGTITQPVGVGTALLVFGSHTYAEETALGTPYTITVSITDAGGSKASVTSSATVADAALMVTGGSTVPATEGTDSGSKQVASFTDGNSTAHSGDFTATIDWGDNTTPTTGTISQPGGAGTAFVVSGSHTYAEESAPGTPYTITVSITDVGGSKTSVTSSATVADANLTGIGGFTVTAPEGADSGSQQVAAFTDANPAAPLGDFTATIDWGDNTTPTTGTISQPGGVGTAFLVSGSHTYAEESAPGTPYKITVSITDVGGSTASVTSSATVADANLTGIGGFTMTATEGSASSSQQVASFTDASPTAPLGDFTATIDWGDNTTPTTGTISQPGGVGTAFLVFGSHSYVEESASGTRYKINVSLRDKGGSTASATSSALIADPAVVATGGFIVTGTETVDTGNQTVATFADPAGAEVLANYSATIAWGDGATSGGSISFDSSTQVFTVTGHHTYTEDGKPTITVTIHHDTAPDAIVTSSAFIRVSSDITDRNLQGGQWFTGVSTGSSFNTTLWAGWSPAVTWVDTLSGDFNGDGKTDIAARDLNTGNWWVGISNGSGFTTSLWTTWNPNVTWVDVQIGDFNGDSKADIVGRDSATGNWWVAQSNGSSFTNALWATWNPTATWVDVKVGDFNGDGKADITGRFLQGGSWWTGVSTGSSFSTSLWATWNPNVTWVDVNVGDFNGDGKADITGRVLEGSTWWTGLSTGASFNTTLWTTWNPNVTWVDVKVGDFNGDGKDDIVGRVLESGTWWVGISSGSAFTNRFWSAWNPNVTWVDVQVGDFNGDGKADITGRVLESGTGWTGISNGSAFTTSLWSTWSNAVIWVDARCGDFA